MKSMKTSAFHCCFSFLLSLFKRFFSTHSHPFAPAERTQKKRSGRKKNGADAFFFAPIRVAKERTQKKRSGRKKNAAEEKKLSDVRSTELRASIFFEEKMRCKSFFLSKEKNFFLCLCPYFLAHISLEPSS
jgi:hypothetical protein